MEEFVKLKDITKVYHMGEVEIRARDNINFSIKKESLLQLSQDRAQKRRCLIF